MKKYTHLFFDLDHTLWDFNINSRATLSSLFNSHVAPQCNLQNFDEFCAKYEVYNEHLWDDFQKGKIERDELRWKRFEKTLLDYNINNKDLVMDLSHQYLEILPSKNSLFEGAAELLNDCKVNGYKLNLITNGFEVTQILKLTNSNILHYFDHVITSEKANALKPDPKIFNFAIQAANAKPEHSLMIGDNYEVDIFGALNVGMDTAWITKEVKSKSKATYTFDNLNALNVLLN